MTSNESARPSRRRVLAAGLGAVALGPSLLSAQDPPRPRRDKPWRIPEGDDPAVLSTAEQRFWSEVLRDHADFFLLLMPGQALEERREEAQGFRDRFDRRLRRLNGEALGKDDYVDANKAALADVREFADWKLERRGEQASGRLRSLVWPSFFQAAAHEAEVFGKRLERLNAGEPAYALEETCELWLGDAADHAALIAHLLDPAERRLVRDATKASRRFAELRATGTPDPLDIAAAAEERHLMEGAIQKAVAEGRVHSTIHPLMADHMVREGLHFIEELKRLL